METEAEHTETQDVRAQPNSPSSAVAPLFTGHPLEVILEQRERRAVRKKERGGGNRRERERQRERERESRTKGRQRERDREREIERETGKLWERDSAI